MQEENQTHLFNDLEFDHTAKQYIRTIASWAMTIVVVAVIGYIVTLADLFSGTEQSVQQSEGFGLGVSFSGTDTTSTVIIILVGLLINFFLYRFARQAKSGIDGLNQNQLNGSFSSLKTYFMIMSIILIILFLIIFLAVIMMSVKSA